MSLTNNNSGGIPRDGNYRITTRADPKARIAGISFNDKTVESPAYFPIIRRSQSANEIQEVLDIVNRLDDGETRPLEHVGGFVFEAERVSRLLESELEEYSGSRQSTLAGRNSFSNFYSLIEYLEKALLIDPNLDRMFYSSSREDYLEASGVPESVVDLLEDSIEGKLDGQPESFKSIRREVTPTNLCETSLRFQRKYRVDLFLSPYLPIDNWNIGAAEDQDLWNEAERDRADAPLPYNIQLYRASAELADLFYDSQVAPVIPLRKSVLKRFTTDADGVGGIPQVWKDIIDTYRELNPPIIFIKATNAEFDPKKPDLEMNRAIVEFFCTLRKWVDDTPIFFLGIGELGYILMAEGLDAYADPIHAQPYETSVAITDEEHRPDPDDIDPTREYLVYRTWTREKFNQLDNFGCPGPFCLPFESRDPSTLGISDQDSLRTKHWFWLRDDELRMLKESIINNQVKISLKDICNDSDWHKNLATFL